MSLVPIGVSVALAAAQGLLNPFLTRLRSIGGITADVTVEEVHTDTTEITRHPVEQGAAITDHAYDQPQELTITAAWSNSSTQSGGDPNYVQEVYQAFLSLKSSRVLLTVITGKRLYTNMLIERITERTDRFWENAMQLVIELREVIRVTTQTVTVPQNSSLANPSSNGATQNRGTVSATPSASTFNNTAATNAGLD